jgi:hypothetical protein
MYKIPFEQYSKGIFFNMASKTNLLATYPIFNVCFRSLASHLIWSDNIPIPIPMGNPIPNKIMFFNIAPKQLLAVRKTSIPNTIHIVR